jgi:hypothetical protein
MMMMMTTPKAPLQNRPNQAGTGVAKTPKACLFNLEQTYEARKKTDHEFMNWWLGTFVVGLATQGQYLVYRYYRNMIRRDEHFTRISQFYSAVGETIHTLAKAEDNTSVNSTLRDFNQILQNEKAKKLIKPIVWWRLPVVSVIAYIILVVILYSFILPSMALSLQGAKEHLNPAIFLSTLGFLPFLIILYSIGTLVYKSFITYGLMNDYTTLEKWDMALLQKTKTMLSDLGLEKTSSISYTTHCKTRNFWIPFFLTIPTLGLIWLYVDYFLISEPAKRFKELPWIQFQILDGLKSVAQKNEDRTKALQQKQTETNPHSDEFLSSNEPSA